MHKTLKVGILVFDLKLLSVLLSEKFFQFLFFPNKQHARKPDTWMNIVQL